MKIPAHTRDAIHDLIHPLDTEERRADYRAGNFRDAQWVKDLDKRYRWDLLNDADKTNPGKFTLEPGTTDAHLDTVLRKIVPPLGEAPKFPVDEAFRYLRSIVAADPKFGDWEVINVERYDGLLLLDLSDGSTISLHVSRAERG